MSVDKAVTQTGLKVERIPPFAIVEPAPSPKPEPDKLKPPEVAPDLPSIKNAVAALNPGEASDFVPVGKGGLIAVLEKRAQADPAGFAEARTQFEARYLTQRRGAVFMEWFRDRRKAAGAALATG
jgi:hypothetical protein